MSNPGLRPRLLAAAAAAGSVACSLEVVADSADGLPEALLILEPPAAPRPRLHLERKGETLEKSKLNKRESPLNGNWT